MITKKRLLYFIILFPLVFLLIARYIVSEEQKKYTGVIYPHVYINGVDFGNQTKNNLKKVFDKKNEALKNLELILVYKDEEIATFSGQLLNLHFESQSVADQAYSIGRSPDYYLRLYQQIGTLLNLKKYYMTAHLNYDALPLKEYFANLETKYNKDAKNALFKFENGKVSSFRQEEKGLAIETSQFFDQFDKKLISWEKNPRSTKMMISDRVIEPEITLAKANNFGIEEEIGLGKSDYSHSIPGRIHNILLAASKFNGILIPKNSEFSFNGTVGDISSSTGYEPAYIIKGGKTVLGDGGGVCQVSTTLFRAALNAGLPITERVAHAYRVYYYENDSPPGFDATVFAPVADLKFKNNTPAGILIMTDIDENNNILSFHLYGKKDNRQVTISNISLYDEQPSPPPSYQDDPTLKKGQVKQTDFASPGGKAKFTYNVTLAGQTLTSQIFYSYYQPWQAVYLRGMAD